MPLNIQLHREILLSILKDVFTDKELGPVLGFKGGTAAYLFYGSERFSVDLDLDLLDSSKEDLVFNKIKKKLEKFGEVKKADKKRYNLFFVLSYKNKLEGDQNIKVEINRRNFGSQYQMQSYMGITMKVMVHEDMFAHKLVAMHERIDRASRDIFDVWFFSKTHWLINKGIVERRSGMEYIDFVNQCVKDLEKFNNRNILHGMGELLNQKQKIWARANLKEDALFFLRLLKDRK